MKFDFCCKYDVLESVLNSHTRSAPLDRESVVALAVRDIAQQTDPTLRCSDVDNNAATRQFFLLQQQGRLQRNGSSSGFSSANESSELSVSDAQQGELLSLGESSLDLMFQRIGFESLLEKNKLQDFGLFGEYQDSQGFISRDGLRATSMYSQLYKHIYLQQFDILHAVLNGKFLNGSSAWQEVPVEIWRDFSKLPNLALFALPKELHVMSSELSQMLRKEVVYTVCHWVQQIKNQVKSGGLDLNDVALTMNALLGDFSSEELMFFDSNVLSWVDELTIDRDLKNKVSNAQTVINECGQLLQDRLALIQDNYWLKNNLTLAKLVLSKSPIFFSAFGEIPRNNHQLVLSVVSRVGLMLEHASERCKKNLEIVLAAVNQASAAYQFVHQGLKFNAQVLWIINQSDPEFSARSGVSDSVYSRDFSSI